MTTSEGLTAAQQEKIADGERRIVVGQRLILGLVLAGEHSWIGRTGKWCQEELGLTDDDMRIAAVGAMDDPRLRYTPLGFESAVEPPKLTPMTPLEKLAADYVETIKRGLHNLHVQTHPTAHTVAYPPAEQ